mgnify:CR=1 FL=1
MRKSAQIQSAYSPPAHCRPPALERAPVALKAHRAVLLLGAFSVFAQHGGCDFSSSARLRSSDSSGSVMSSGNENAVSSCIPLALTSVRRLASSSLVLRWLCQPRTARLPSRNRLIVSSIAISIFLTLSHCKRSHLPSAVTLPHFSDRTGSVHTVRPVPGRLPSDRVPRRRLRLPPVLQA